MYRNRAMQMRDLQNTSKQRQDSRQILGCSPPHCPVNNHEGHKKLETAVRVADDFLRSKHRDH